MLERARARSEHERYLFAQLELGRTTLELLGLTKEEVIGKLDRDFLPAAQADFVLARDREVLAAGRLVNVPEQSIDSRLHGVRILNTMKMPIFDESGTLKFLLGISVDITERKLAESAVRELNAELQAKAAQLEATNGELESLIYEQSTLTSKVTALTPDEKQLFRVRANRIEQLLNSMISGRPANRPISSPTASRSAATCAPLLGLLSH